MKPENVLTKSCLEGYNNYKRYNNHKAYAYARENKTDLARCNWSYSHKNVEEAKESALKACQKVAINDECKIVDADAKFNVADGTYSSLVPVDNTALNAEAKKQLTNEAKKIILGNCLPFFTNQYLNSNGHKSFGYSIDANGNYACGYSYSNQTEKISKKNAIKSCEDNKLKRGKLTPKSPCKVYSTNNKILLTAKNFGVSVEKKEDILLSSEDYNTKFTQAKNIIDDGACLIQMKYYLKGKMQQAYYFAKENGKQACGRKENAFTLDAAKKEAKKSCNKMAKRKHIKTKCKLFAQNFDIVAKRSDYIVKMSKENYEKALHKGKLNEVKRYIAKGYNIDIETKKDGVTPLFLAAVKGDKTFFFELVKKGANIKHRTKDCTNLLHAAIFRKRIELIKYLISKGIDINAQGFRGNTPLHVAVIVKNKEIVKLLIKKGAKTDIKNAKGKLASELDGWSELNIKILKDKKSSSTSNTKTAYINQVLSVAANNFNKGLPKMTDKETRLDKVTVEDKKMIFNYTLVNFTNWTMPKEKLHDLLYKETKSTLCKDKDTQALLKKGAVIAYKYIGKNKNIINTFKFDASVCGLKTNKEKLREMLKNIGKK